MRCRRLQEPPEISNEDRSRWWRGALGVLLWATTATASWSQSPSPLEDLDLEDLLKVEVVEAASKYEQASSRAPAAVTILTRDQIRKFGYRSISEAIRGVRGFYTTYDRSYNYTGVRGFGRPADYDSRLLVLVNGHRVNDSIYGSSPLGSDFILDIDLVDRIEIVRGPSSSIHGSNAFFGVINIITRDASSIEGIEVSGDAAQFDTYQGRATFARTLDNGAEVMVSGTRGNSHGDPYLYFPEFDSPSENNGIAENLDGEGVHSFFGRVTYEKFVLESAYLDRIKDVPTAAYGTIFNDDGFTTEDRRYYVDLSYTTPLADTVTLTARTFYDWYEYQGDYPYDYREEGALDPLRVVNRDTARGEKYGFQAHLEATTFAHHRLLLGAEARNDFNQDQQNFDLDPFDSYLDDTSSERMYALFAQDDYSVTDWFTLHGGLRFDHYTTVDSEVNPRVGLLFFPRDDTAIKLLYGRAFRAPSAFELYYQDPNSQKQAIGLDSESIDTYEAVLEHTLNKHTRFTIAGYHYSLDGLIDQIIDPDDDRVMFVNRDEIRAYGIESEIEARWAEGWSIRSSYTFQETRDSVLELPLTNSPRHLWKSHLVAPLYGERFFAGVEVLYTSTRRSISDGPAREYWLTNLTVLAKDLLPDFELSASVYNLFDGHYGDPGSNEHRQKVIPGDGVAWRVQGTYRF